MDVMLNKHSIMVVSHQAQPMPNTVIAPPNLSTKQIPSVPTNPPSNGIISPLATTTTIGPVATATSCHL
jgi:hypothetical protein